MGPSEGKGMNQRQRGVCPWGRVPQVAACEGSEVGVKKADLKKNKKRCPEKALLHGLIPKKVKFPIGGRIGKKQCRQ